MVQQPEVYSRQLGSSSRVIGKDRLLLMPRPGRSAADSILWLNAVGGYIWDLIDGARTQEEIVGIVSRDFKVSVDQAAADAKVFFHQLLSAGAIQSAVNHEERHD